MCSISWLEAGRQTTSPASRCRSSWWAYLVGPLAGGLIAVGFAYVLRGRGGGQSGQAAAQGTIGVTWHPGTPES